MKTHTVKKFYNNSLKSTPVPYEQGRWFRNSQSYAGYASTKKAMQKYALPHLKNDMEVFELGPGPGTWTKLMLKHSPSSQYSLIDISEEMIKQAKAALSVCNNISYIISDVLDYQSPNTYDFFFSSRILEYVPEKEVAIDNIVQAMKSGAYGYIVTKTPQEERFMSKKKSSEIHSLQISPDNLIELLLKRGCVVHKKVHVTCVFPKIKNGFMDSVLTSVCQFLPFTIGQQVSESYALVFQKK